MSIEPQVESPNVTLKWRENEPPYVEVYQNNELLAAGWVHPVPALLPKENVQETSEDLVW